MSLSTAPLALTSVIKNAEVFCDTSKTLCLKGRLSVSPRDGVARLQARVNAQTRPGFIIITLRGYRENSFVESYIQGRIRGRHSEIVDIKNGASVHSNTRWVLHRFQYLSIE